MDGQMEGQTDRQMGAAQGVPIPAGEPIPAGPHGPWRLSALPGANLEVLALPLAGKAVFWAPQTDSAFTADSFCF